MASLQRVKFHA